MVTILATGLSKGERSVETAEEAVRQAKDNLERRACACSGIGIDDIDFSHNGAVDLAIVYCSSRYDYQEVIEVVRRETNGAPLVGCSTAGEFTERRVEKGGIAVGLLSSEEIKFFTAMVEGVRADPELAVRTIANEFPHFDGYPYLSAIMHLDGLAGVGEEITLLTSSVFNQIFGRNVMLVGGAAGDDLKFRATALFSDDMVASDALSVCMLASATKRPLFADLEHVHVPVSPPLRITRAEGCVLYEIEGRPAWDVWKEQTAEAARGAGIDTTTTQPGGDMDMYLLRFELGLPTRTGRYKIRLPLSRNEDGSLNFGCTIPEGATFRIMESARGHGYQNQIESAQDAARIAIQNLNGEGGGGGEGEIAGALIFDCACRGFILGNGCAGSANRFKSVSGSTGIPVLGGGTYGEICMEPGQFSGFHNTSSVVLLIPK